jgi:hypothetical protein
MSVHVSSWVLRECDESVPGRRLVLLVLADKADADGSGAFPSVATMAHETRMSERGVRYALRALEADDRIRRAGIHPQYGTHEYVVVMRNPLQGAQSAGGQSDADQVSQIAPEPSLGTVPSLEQSIETRKETAELPLLIDAKCSEPSREGAREGQPLKFNGRKVPGDVESAARAALGRWNERMGQTLRPVNGRGKMTDSLRVIVGAMLDYPEAVTLWPAMIDAALRSPWWSDDAPGPGVVFGGKVRERMIQQAQRPAIAASPNGNVHSMRLSGGAAKDGWGAADILAIGKRMQAEADGRVAS